MATCYQTDHSMTSILGLNAARPEDKRRDSPVDLSSQRPSKRHRRSRTYFDDQSVMVLEDSYYKTKYPDVIERTKIAQQINEEETRVQIWFQNRRAREARKRRSSDVKIKQFINTKRQTSPPTTKPEQIKKEPIYTSVEPSQSCVEPVPYVEPVQRVPEPVYTASEPLQTVPTPTETYRQFSAYDMLSVYSSYLYQSQFGYHHQSHLPYYPWATSSLSYTLTPDSSDSSVQQVPQSVVLDLSKKKQTSPTVTPESTTMFLDSPPNAISPIPMTPRKENLLSNSSACNIYTSSPISERFSCLPSLYRTAFSPVSNLHTFEPRPADMRPTSRSSSGKEETLPSDLLIECDALNSGSNNDSDVIILDFSTQD